LVSYPLKAMCHIYHHTPDPATPYKYAFTRARGKMSYAKNPATR